mmetsp:Transcript_136360/g.303954  ORF Transcript_136360/g.303954 Transcript_136360/m.303954 type:complete len:656 (-) Transcript_136360:45-2012(-)
MAEGREQPVVSWREDEKSKQPPSLTPFECRLSIPGTEETLGIPVVVSTKVIEVKYMLCSRLGVHPDEIKFVAKQGPLARVQNDHEECRRHIAVMGIRSFSRQRRQYEDPFVIIGAGHLGLRHGLWNLKYKNTHFIIVDRRHRVGGTSWLSQANKTSKLQTELGSYHLQYDESNPVPTNLPPWPTRDQLLQHFHEVTVEYGLMPYIKFNTNVTCLDILGKNADSGPIRMHLEDTDGRYSGVMIPPPTGRGIQDFPICGCSMYPGNLTMAMRESYKGEEQFGGDITYAMFNEYDYSRLDQKRVVIVGHGAFAVENVRTCCEYNAFRIYMVCRRKNLACPRVCSWLINQTGMTPQPCCLYMKATEPAYNLLGVDPWSYHSVTASSNRVAVTLNQKSRFGIGDVYFVANAMGKCEVIVDQVKRLGPGVMHLESGRKLEVSVILKCLGFVGDWEVDRLMKMRECNGFWANNDNRRFVVAEFPGVSCGNLAGTSFSPGAIQFVEMASHYMNFPSDFNEMVASGSLPVHFPDAAKDKPAYVLDARQGTAVCFVVPNFAPQIQERQASVYWWLKKQKQWECHPMEVYVAQCKEEWDNYAQKWYEEDPTLNPPPPYPYNPKMVQEFLDQIDEYEQKGKNMFSDGGIIKTTGFNLMETMKTPAYP